MTRYLTGLLASVLLSTGAAAQHFNIDLESDQIATNPPTGGYSAATPQTGPWNVLRVGVAGLPTTAITPLCGTISGLSPRVSITTTGTVVLGGTLAPGCGTFGPVDQSFYDGVLGSASNGKAQMLFEGLLPGDYRLYVYGGSTVSSSTSVEANGVADGFANQCPTNGTAHQMNSTYVALDVEVGSNGELFVQVGSALVNTRLAVSGMQLTRMSGIGFNGCVLSTNSTGAPAVMSAAASSPCGFEASISANDLVLTASPVPALQAGYFFYSTNTGSPIALGNGFRCVFGVHRFPVTQHIGQVASLSVDYNNVPAAITAGTTHYFQYFFRDLAGGGQGHNATDMLEIMFTP